MIMNHMTLNLFKMIMDRGCRCSVETQSRSYPAFLKQNEALDWLTIILQLQTVKMFDPLVWNLIADQRLKETANSRSPGI